MNLQKLSATIITGFLGCGKTSLLRHLLNNAQGVRYAVIVNEFGSIGIDGEILQECPIECESEQSGQLYELANGCICCTVQEEFFPVMQELVSRRHEIDHLLIETSGLALPKPLVQAFNWPEIKNHCTVNAVITMVDAPAVLAGQFAHDPQAVQQQRQADENLDHLSSLQELFEDQLSAADLVLINKIDQLSEQDLQTVRMLIKDQLPEQVKILHTQHGNIDAQWLFGLQKAAEAKIDHVHSHHHHHDDHDHDEYQSLHIPLAETHLDTLIAALHTLLGEEHILRLKGFVPIKDKPMRLVVQGVGRRIDHYFEGKWPENQRQGGMVFIGKALQAEKIEQRLLTLLGKS